MRLELKSFTAIYASIREINKPAQVAFLFALSLTALAAIELIFPFRPRWNDWFITKMLRHTLGPEGPALLPLIASVFLYAYAIGSLFGNSRNKRKSIKQKKRRKLQRNT
jgi:hypothetical protein